MTRSSLLLLTVLWVIVSSISSFAAGPPVPYRIGGTLTIDGVQKTQSDTGLVIKVTKPDGTVYTNAAGTPAQATTLNAGNLYIIDVPIYDATAQPGGAATNESARIQVLLDGTALTVTAPPSGTFTVGASGALQPNMNLTVISSFTVTGSSTGHGTVSCQSPVTLGSSSLCSITPDGGYHLAGLTDNNVSTLASVTGASYTIANVTENHAVAGTFSIYGNLNADDKIDVFDALLVLQYALSLIPHNAENDARYKVLADVYPTAPVTGAPKGDGNVDIFDALMILQRAVNLISW